jgi:uncharacterized protein (DUF952 family)
MAQTRKKSESSWEREPTSRKYYKTRPNAIGVRKKNYGAPAQRCPPRVFSLILSRRRVSVHAANLQDLPCKVVARHGFIHFSNAAQAPETAAKHFAGQADLLLIAVEAEALGSALRYEVSRGGALFPHLHAPLPLSAVRWAKPLPLGADGRHVFPELA